MRNTQGFPPDPAFYARQSHTELQNYLHVHPCVAVPFLFDAWQGGAIATEQHIDELFADWEQRNN